MNENERRQALADFLRGRRERLTPGEVGLPAGLRRRTPGLRREEVAQLASVGTSWYVWLEQGRDVRPSGQVLESLAQALRLTPNERRHLFLLAGQAQPTPSIPVDEHLNPALQRMLDELVPTPAYVTGRRMDYLAWNKAADRLFSISAPTSPYVYNMVWRLFTTPAQNRSERWEMLARGTLAEFRAASARYPGDSFFEELIEDLKEASPEFCLWWPHHDARRALDGHKSIPHATLGRLEFEHVTLQVINDPDVRMVVYTPDATTRAKIQDYLAQETAPDSAETVF